MVTAAFCTIACTEEGSGLEPELTGISASYREKIRSAGALTKGSRTIPARAAARKRFAPFRRFSDSNRLGDFWLFVFRKSNELLVVGLFGLWLVLFSGNSERTPEHAWMIPDMKKSVNTILWYLLNL
ncbi:MAG: hypothetical protein ACI8UO_000047 [Verrucomicrobiales bacterium]